jgi:hypothetical protein
MEGYFCIIKFKQDDMKKRLTLQLNIYPKHGGKACLVFKKEDLLLRINSLLDPQFFVAGMVQLDLAVRSGASQYCHYVLNATRGQSWVLAVIHELGTVSLELLRQARNGGKPEPVFDWAGRPDEFRSAVRGLGLMYQGSGMSGLNKK